MPLNPSADIVFADGPLSAPHHPYKPDVRRIFRQLEQAMDAFSSGAGSIAKASKAQLTADLAHSADVTAWVYNDPAVSNNGIYRKSGGIGAGTWTRILDLPFSFIIGADNGAGTPNAIQATSTIPVSSSALVVTNVFESNTGSPVTIQFNGGPVLTVKTNSGQDVLAGGLVGGMLISGYVSGSTFRLVSDQASAAILAAAEDALAQYETIRDLAESALQPNTDVAVTSATVSNVVKTGTLRQTPGVPHDGLFLGGDNGVHIMCEGLVGDEGSWAVYPGTVNRSSALSLAPSGLPSSMNGEDTSSLALQLQNGSGDGYSGERRGVITMKKWGELRYAAFRTSVGAGPIPYLSFAVQDRKFIKMADDNVVRFTNELLAGGTGGNTVAVFENPATNVTVRFGVTTGGSALIEHLTSNVVDNTINVGPNGLAVGGAGIGLGTHRIEAAGVGASQGAVSAYANDAAYVGEVVRISTAKAKAANFAFLTARANGDLAFNLRGDGNAFADGSWSGGGADYAEYFEWADANAENEDRIGFSVVLDGGKIRVAGKGEDPIGVVSATAFVVGDADGGFWRGKYLRDDFGRYLMEEVETISWDEQVSAKSQPSTRTHEYDALIGPNDEVLCISRDIRERKDGETVVALVDGDGNDICPVAMDENGAKSVPIGYRFEKRTETEQIEIQIEAAKIVRQSYYVDQIPKGVTPPNDAQRDFEQRRKINPAYDSTTAYDSRESRREWATVGLMGKLRIRKGLPVGSRWLKIRDISVEVEEWLVR